MGEGGKDKDVFGEFGFPAPLFFRFSAYVEQALGLLDRLPALADRADPAGDSLPSRAYLDRPLGGLSGPRQLATAATSEKTSTPLVIREKHVDSGEHIHRPAVGPRPQFPPDGSNRHRPAPVLRLKNEMSKPLRGSRTMGRGSQQKVALQAGKTKAVMNPPLASGRARLPDHGRVQHPHRAPGKRLQLTPPSCHN